MPRKSTLHPSRQKNTKAHAQWRRGQFGYLYPHCLCMPLLAALEKTTLADFARDLQATTHPKMLVSHVQRDLQVILRNNGTQYLYDIDDGQPSYFLVQLAAHLKCSPEDIVPEPSHARVTRKTRAYTAEFPAAPINLIYLIAHYENMDAFRAALLATPCAAEKGVDVTLAALDEVMAGRSTGYDAQYQKGDIVIALEQIERPRGVDFEPLRNPYDDTIECKAGKLKKQMPHLPDCVVMAIAEKGSIYAFAAALPLPNAEKYAYANSMKISEVIGKKGIAYTSNPRTPMAVARAIADYVDVDVKVLFPLETFCPEHIRAKLRGGRRGKQAQARPAQAGSKDVGHVDAVEGKYPLMPPDFEDMAKGYGGSFEKMTAALPPNIQVTAQALERFAWNGGVVRDGQGRFRPEPLAVHWLLAQYSIKNGRAPMPLERLFTTRHIGLRSPSQGPGGPS